MTRAYRVEVCVKSVSTEDVRRLMTDRLGWEEMSVMEYRGIVAFIGKGWLSGGESEEEAHSDIYGALKAINPKALISTKWTYLEELPFNTYGDDFNVDTPAEAG